MESDVVGVAEQILYTIQDFLWIRGILHTGYAADKRRIAGAVALLLAFTLYGGIVGFGGNTAPIMIILKGVGLFFIFNDRFIVFFLKYFCSVFYMSMVTLPVRIIYYLVCVNLWKDIDISVAGIGSEMLQCLAIFAVACFLSKKRWWQEMVEGLTGGELLAEGILALFASGSWEISYLLMEEIEGEAIGVRIFYAMLSFGFVELLYLAGVLLLFLYRARAKLQKENQDKDDLLQKTEEHYQYQEEEISEVRSKQHDIYYHLRAMESYLDGEGTEEAKKYMGQVLEHTENEKRRVPSVGIGAADAVIAEISNEFPEELKFSCQGKIPSECEVKAYDMCIIFSNLLANAWEACRRLRHHDMSINIRIQTLGSRVVIDIENPIEWDFDENKIGSYTSKNNADRKHGYGLLNVRKAVERNGGEMIFRKNNDFLTVRVVL